MAQFMAKNPVSDSGTKASNPSNVLEDTASYSAWFVMVMAALAVAAFVFRRGSDVLTGQERDPWEGW